VNWAPTLVILLGLTACAVPGPAREPRIEDALWKRLEVEVFPACEMTFQKVRDRHECMIDAAWLVWAEAGLEWSFEMQSWAQALLTHTYAHEHQARRLKRAQRKASTNKIDEAEWERIRRAADAAVEQLRRGRNQDWQAGYEQGFDDALPPVEDFNETFGAWTEPTQEKR